MKAKKRLKKTKYYGVSFQYQFKNGEVGVGSQQFKTVGTRVLPDMAWYAEAIKGENPEYSVIMINNIFEISPRAYNKIVDR